MTITAFREDLPLSLLVRCMQYRSSWPPQWIVLPGAFMGTRIVNDEMLVDTFGATYRIQFRPNRNPRLRKLGPRHHAGESTRPLLDRKGLLP
jgi:hypothetical protein